MSVCDFSELPIGQCACRNCRPDVDAPEKYEVFSRFEAMFDGGSDCGHRIEAGDTIGYSVDHELLCARCIA